MHNLLLKDNMLDEKSDAKALLERLVIELKSAHSRLIGANIAETVGIGADGQPTSRIDAALEGCIIDALKESSIPCSLVSEEMGKIDLNGGSDVIVFILDPLDGTSNALMGFPFYASSIALQWKGELYAGLVYHFATQDVYYGEKGVGSFKNGLRIRVNDSSKLCDSPIVVSKPTSAAETMIYQEWTNAAKRSRMTGCPALDCCYVASGVFSAYIDVHLEKGLLFTHDLAAAKIILEEAGGIMMDPFERSPLILDADFSKTYNVTAVNNHAVFDDIVSFIVRN
jgi:fructose-1,6-bisphosphatase/inositol monophosphatase family enzyme